MGFDFIKALEGHKNSEAGAAAKVAEETTEEPTGEEVETKAPEQKPAAEKTAAQEKAAAFVDFVEKRTEKVANLLTEEKDEKHSQLFRNCVSACFHFKMAGYAPEESDEPSTFMAMAYNMYKDILAKNK